MTRLSTALGPIFTAACAAALATAGASAAAQHAHEHGVLRLAVSIDGGELGIALQAPLDSLVGFERAPRTDAERRAASQALARLSDGAALFKPDPAAQCALFTTDVAPGRLGPGPASTAGEHADLDASYVFRCARPDQLRSLQTGLFEAFARTRRIEVQVAGPGGQRRQVLARPARQVDLAR